MSIDAEVAVLKSDVSRIILLFEKLDATIDKVGTASNNIAQMLAVHEEKINKHEEVNEELFTLVERRKQELQSDIKELHSRISTVTRELSSDISETEQRLMTAMTNGMSEIKRCITQETKIIQSENKDLDKRITDLERWKWLVMGGSVVIGAFAHELVTLILPK